MSFDSGPERHTQAEAVSSADVSGSAQETPPPPFFLPEQVADDSALAAGLLAVIKDISGANSRGAYVKRLDWDQELRESVEDPRGAADRAQGNQLAKRETAWDAFMRLAGYPQFIGLNGSDPAVNGTSAHGLWAKFNQSYAGPNHAKARARYTRALGRVVARAAAEAGAIGDEQ